MAAASTCAHALTEAGRVPFTRCDLIECVKPHAPNAKPDSIHPVIQGITDNLEGGAPGAAGKDILHSVGRGKFVLRSNTSAQENRSSPIGSGSVASRPWEELPASPSRAMPKTEGELRDELLRLLCERFCDTNCAAEAEGTVTYRLPDGTVLNHASDILVSRPGSARQVSIEIKYKSAVTDQFKCRSYDAAHMKEAHGEDLLTVMLFARAGSGIGIDRARSICHAFDRFYGNDAARFLAADGLDELVTDIRSFLL